MYQSACTELGSHWTDFFGNLILGHFLKICQKNSRIIKNITRIARTLHEDQYDHILVISS
jgi:hypothetical protein